MKNSYLPLLVAVLLAPAGAVRGQSVGVGTTTPDPSAALDVKSSSQGLLPPRLTAAERDAIAAPAAGLLVYQTDGSSGLYYFNGTNWVNATNGRAPNELGSTVPVNGRQVSVSDQSPLNAGLTAIALHPSGTFWLVRQSGHVVERGMTRYGTLGTAGDADGDAATARFNFPSGVSSDNFGVGYVADIGNGRIRKISAEGIVSTLATPFPGALIAVVVAGNGVLYVLGGNRIFKVMPTGTRTTLAGTGAVGSADGPGATATFRFSASGVGVSALALDAQGNLYATEPLNHTVRKITPAGVVSTLAGAAGVAGSTDGPGAAARFNTPTGVAVDGGGAVYVADRGNFTVRKISAAGNVSRFAGIVGTQGCFNGPADIARLGSVSGLCVDEDGVVSFLDEGVVGTCIGNIRVIK